MTAKKTTKTTTSHSTVHPHGADVSTGESTTATATTTPATAIPVEIQASPSASASSPAATPATDPFDAKVQQFIAYLSTLPVLLGSQASPAAPLSIQDRRSLPKMKTGAEKEIPGVLNLADEYGVSLPGGTTTQARADTLRSATLVKLAAKLSSALLLVEDQNRVAQGRTWKVGRKAYKALADQVADFPAIQQQLAPMASFMATKHKDAPTILRPAEAKTLSKSRATAKEKKAKEAGAVPVAAPVVSPPVITPVVVAPVAAAPAAQPATFAPAAPANGAPTTNNGAPHP